MTIMMNEMDQMETGVTRIAVESVAAATLAEHVNVDLKAAIRHSASRSIDFTGTGGGGDGEYFSTATRETQSFMARGLKHSSSTPILFPVGSYRPTSPRGGGGGGGGGAKKKRNSFTAAVAAAAAAGATTSRRSTDSNEESAKAYGTSFVTTVGSNSFMSTGSSLERDLATSSSRSLRRRSRASARVEEKTRRLSQSSRTRLSDRTLDRTLSSQSLHHLTTMSLFEAMEKIVYVSGGREVGRERERERERKREREREREREVGWVEGRELVLGIVRDRSVLRGVYLFHVTYASRLVLDSQQLAAPKPEQSCQGPG